MNRGKHIEEKSPRTIEMKRKVRSERKKTERDIKHYCLPSFSEKPKSKSIDTSNYH
jgi:hypothetical protein